MKNVFISYRHVEPDQSLARSIEQSLIKRRLKVFLDTNMLVGTKWAQKIERQIRTSHYFVVLISKQSILSDMVRREIKLAHKLSERSKDPLTILPIRVAFEGELPYDLGAYLDPIQYVKWKDGDPHEMIVGQILAAIEQSVVLPEEGKSPDDSSTAGLEALAQATAESGAPLPAADPRLELDTGTVQLTSQFYVRRGADDELERQVPRDGTTSIVKGPRQIGKSSLIARALAQAVKNSQKSCLIDFQLLPSSKFETLDVLLKHLAQKLARGLNTAVKPQEKWDDDLDAMENLSSFVQEAVLISAPKNKPVLLVLDEADRVFKFPYRDDFFSLIRGWHNTRATNNLWKKLNIVIAHSTEPSLWIQDVDRSPFNVGLRLRLDDFSVDQVTDLNNRHGQPLKKETDIRELMDLVSGHPYLIRQSLYALVRNGWSMNQLATEAAKETGPFGDHLRQWVWRLQDNKELQAELRTVLDHKCCKDEGRFQRLKAAGLVIGEKRTAVRMRCRLYDLYFKDHL